MHLLEPYFTYVYSAVKAYVDNTIINWQLWQFCADGTKTPFVMYTLHSNMEASLYTSRLFGNETLWIQSLQCADAWGYISWFVIWCSKDSKHLLGTEAFPGEQMNLSCFYSSIFTPAKVSRDANE